MAENPSVAESIAAAFEHHEAASEAPPPESAPSPSEKPVSPAIPDEKPSTIEAERGEKPGISPEHSPAKDRDGKGRFAKKEGAESPEGESTLAPEPPKEPPKDAEPPKSDAPEHWPSADKEMFSQQTPEAQTFLTRRMKEMEQGFQTKTTELAAFTKAAEPFAELMKTRGISPPDAFARMLKMDHYLRHPDPKIRAKVHGDIARMYNITSVESPNPALEDELPEDEQLRKVTERQDRLEQNLKSRQDQDRATQQQANSAKIQEFIDAKTEAGDSAHPHAERLMPEMVRLAKGYTAQGQPPPSLDKLYESATWGDSETRQEMLTAQQTAAAAREEEERKAHAEKAREATAKHPTGDSPSSASKPKQPKNVRDAVSSAWDQHSGGDSSRI